MDVLDRYAPLLDDHGAFLAACRRPLPSVVRVNTLKTSVGRARRALADDGVDATPVDWHDGLLELDTDRPGTTWPYFLGWLHGQEEVSAIPPLVLDPDPGDRVLDACAAPGSKATQLAALMEDTGRLVANDDNLGRLAPLRSNAERLGVTNVAVTNQDARQFSLNPFDFDAFDATLVDAPCTGEGTVRKNPTALDEWSPAAVEGMAGLQKGILRRAIQATKPGGTVVYSTCTFAPEENEAVLDHALDVEACRLVDFDPPIDAAPGTPEWGDVSYDPTVERAKRFFPHHNDTGGFFCAKLEVIG